MLDKLEHVRQTVEVIDDACLQDVDASLAELAALCDAKGLKSRFHRAGRAAMVLNRLGENTPKAQQRGSASGLQEGNQKGKHGGSVRISQQGQPQAQSHKNKNSNRR